jgi:uncharacterized protein YegL
MATKYDQKEIASSIMVLFFMVDTSGSMAGSKIGVLNEAMNNVIPEIQKISADSADAKIQIAAIKFSCGAEWIYPVPIDVENFKWKYLDADGLTDFGAACKALNEKLSRKEGGFMSSTARYRAPAIFLLSDGEPTDEFHTSIEQLKNNNWFKYAIKVAIAIGDNANEDVLSKFTGDIASVVKVNTPEAFAKLIRFVVLSSSHIGLKTKDVGAIDSTSIDTFKQQVQTYVAQQNDTDEDEWW